MTALWMIVLCGALSIVYAIWATASVLKADAGNARMQEIAALSPPRRCAGHMILAWSRRFKAALLGRAGLLFMRPPLPR